MFEHSMVVILVIQTGVRLVLLSSTPDGPYQMFSSLSCLLRIMYPHVNRCKRILVEDNILEEAEIRYSNCLTFLGAYRSLCIFLVS